MPDQTLLLGLELTSSHLIILLIDQKGQVIEKLQRSHGAQGSEQAPQDWWRAVRTGIKETLRRAKIGNKEIRAIGITAASDAPILLDYEGKVLCKTHVGLSDGDAGELNQLLTKNVGVRNLHNITNQPARSNAIAAKLLAMREKEKRAWHDAAHVLMPSSFLRYRLTGKHSIDAGSAGETQLFNTKQRAWSKVLLQRIGVPPAWMPQIGPGTQICGRVEENAAKESGLAIGTPVIQAGHRSSCIAVAMGTQEPGDAILEMNNYGTLAINSNTFTKLDQERFYATCNGMNDNWMYCANDCASTKNTDWLLNEIATNERTQARRSKQDPVAKLSEVAAEIAPGSDGLMFCSPNNEHSGGFAGLNLDHKHGHMIRAVFESSAMTIRSCLNQYRALKVDEGVAANTVASLTLTGITSSNELWSQIIADACNITVKTAPYEYPAALGAALLAGSCIGTIKDINKVVASLRKDGQTLEPRAAASAVYDKMENPFAQLEASTQNPETLADREA